MDSELSSKIAGDGLLPAPLVRSRAHDPEVVHLQNQIERLLLTTEALWRIVKEKLDCDELELVRRITLIDLEDGRLDARKPPSPPKPCPKCERILIKGLPRCLFCGEPVALDPFER